MTLAEDIERRHVCVTQDVDVAGQRVTLLKPRSIEALIDEEDFSRDERLPYWADLWPASRALSDAVASESGAGRSCLELGCGLGLSSIAALRAGYDVTATDYYDDALLFAQFNVMEASGRTPATRMVNWTEMPPDLGRFDVVLASDVLYEHRYAPLVANAIASTLVRGGEAIVADPGRIALEGFLDECRQRGLVANGDPRAWSEGEIKQTVTLWKLKWE